MHLTTITLVFFHIKVVFSVPYSPICTWRPFQNIIGHICQLVAA